jgi:riboflavin kinase
VSALRSERLKSHLWFTLYRLLNLGAGSREIRVSTTELSSILGCSQQSASRHLKILEDWGLIQRRVGTNGSHIRITEEGLRTLWEIYYGLRRHLEEAELEAYTFEGVLFTGLGEGAYYITRDGYREQIREKLGFDPYPGTLNLRLSGGYVELKRRLARMPAIILEGFRDEERSFGSVRCYPAVVNEDVEGAVVIAERTIYDDSVLEVISPIDLRKHFSLRDGDLVRVSASSPRRSSSLSSRSC